ncbi:hypothetical protein [Microvirga aerophila]|uniref:Uncharacterized protein n=1 Tax=Microvirga aerophila TaxID=670291 RepID=A0A512BWK8_9HYPH|nr:hypothetical protein [Microvirga aerophila]GEO16344.1 hypothetical protein MAE02_40400 [Microvirga aerophila]
MFSQTISTDAALLGAIDTIQIGEAGTAKAGGTADRARFNHRTMYLTTPLVPVLGFS